MPCTRFAPAPTGLLHLGHVANAIYVWGLGRVRGAGVLLRIEDHDRQRASPDFERALLDDLDWLGLVPDRFPTHVFRAGTCESRQRDRAALYEDAAAGLDRQGRLYACRCSRQDWTRTGSHHRPAPGWCPRGCRGRVPFGTDDITWRLVMPEETVAYDDLLLGPQQQPTAAEGDLVVRDRLGNWTYQFAVTVDDWLQGIDLVIRGRDLLASTGRQIAVGAMLGRARPAVFAHHPLIMKSPDRKLSKADNDTGIGDLRRAGWSPSQVFGAAAAQVGLIDRPDPIEIADFASLFIR